MKTKKQKKKTVDILCWVFESDLSLTQSKVYVPLDTNKLQRVRGTVSAKTENNQEAISLKQRNRFQAFRVLENSTTWELTIHLQFLL